MKPICFLNGEMLLSENARIGISDLGLLRAYGVFDYFRVHKGQPLFLPDYLRRFRNSAEQALLHLPFDDVALKGIIEALIRRNDLETGGIRLLLTGGYAPDGYTAPAAGNFAVLAYDPPVYAPETTTQGLSLVSHEYQREMPEVKTTNYVVPLALRNKIAGAGASDVLYHSRGLFSEMSRSNFFLVLPGNVVVTPHRFILHGVTRQKVISLAGAYYRVELRDVATTELDDALEAFTTSSTRGVMPVTRIDGNPVGNGLPGPVTKHLIALFEDLIDGQTPQNDRAEFSEKMHQ